MKMRKLGLMAMSVGLMAAAAGAEPGHGLGSEQKDAHVSTNQQSGWWTFGAADGTASKCECGCGSGMAVNRGLATEHKDPHISSLQQSGWGYQDEAPAKPACRVAEKPKPVIIAEAPAKPVVKAPVDSDGDGVPDDRDNCEGTPHGVKVDEHGCPQEAKAVPEKEWNLEGVEFETGSDKLKRNSLASLDEAVEILKTHTRIVVEIQGHTDSVGGTAANQKLSVKRAEAVKQYLIEKGVKADRLHARGYGESSPIADNKTAEGRAKNRRIAFKVLSR